MGVSAKEYKISVSFCHKLMIFGKKSRLHLWILSKNLNFLKHINLLIPDHYV
jgi:hypothetical protein